MASSDDLYKQIERKTNDRSVLDNELARLQQNYESEVAKLEQRMQILDTEVAKLTAQAEEAKASEDAQAAEAERRETALKLAAADAVTDPNQPRGLF